MPTIWAAISGHGYGHAAQVVPVLNELGTLVPGLKAILRTTVPASFFQDRVTIPWDLQSVQQDIGCVQRGPLAIDIPATWDAHVRFHSQWNHRIERELDTMRSVSPQIVLADTPYLAVSAGREAGLPTVLLANFTWSEILKPLADPEQPHQHAMLTDIEQLYGRADSALRIAPGLPLTSIKKVVDIGPIAQPAHPRRQDIRAYLGLSERERSVLVGFGGVPLASLPWTGMESMAGYRFIVDGRVPIPSVRIHSLSSLPFSFKTLLASVDVVMTKPGYGTIVEAVAIGMPVLYVRRYNFADEQPLVEFLHGHGRGQELSLHDFQSGNWAAALESILEQPVHPIPPACTGAADAARHLAQYF